MSTAPAAELILTNGRVTTMSTERREAAALAVRGGRFVAVGDEAEVLRHKGPETVVVDARGRRVIPGLIDSHTHVIRAGLNYDLELRWDGVPSVADALRLLREQARRTPAPHWVRVVGGWSEFQFAERRMPTLEEINEAAPETPVFILHLYAQALLNKAALRAVGYTRDTPDPPGARIERDRNGEPTGLLVAKPNAHILYATLAMGPKLGPEDQRSSTLRFMRELNRLGVTGAIDAGGGFQRYPDDYGIIQGLAREDALTLRIAYNLFTQRPKQELADFEAWVGMVKPGQGDSFFRCNGAGEMLVFSAADFEDFMEPRPDLGGEMERDLEAVVELLAANRWPFRVHATYDESIGRMLDVFEAVNRRVPFEGLRWFFDHAETISARSIERVARLGGGVAIQHRMAYQGEHFLRRYGAAAARRAPPVRELLAAGLPVGGGTDATRVASYNPWIGLQWLVSGQTVGQTELNAPGDRLSREEALRLYTAANAWFSGEDGEKGRIEAGLLGDFAILSDDYFVVPEGRIQGITSVLTCVGGRVVHAAGEHGGMAPPPPPAAPDWSPSRHAPGWSPSRGAAAKAMAAALKRPAGRGSLFGCDCAY